MEPMESTVIEYIDIDNESDSDKEFFQDELENSIKPVLEDDIEHTITAMNEARMDISIDVLSRNDSVKIKPIENAVEANMERIIELSLKYAAKCIYNQTSECLQLGAAQFRHVALCGYIKQLEINQALMNMTISDGIHSLQISAFSNKQPESIKTYLCENMKKIEYKLDNKIANRTDFTRAFDLAVLSLQSTINSISYAENMKLDDLVLISGAAFVKDGIFCFKTHKMKRILYNQEDYLEHWNRSIQLCDFEA